MSTPRRVMVLGASGSIGKNTLAVIRKFPGDFTVTALSVSKSIDMLAAEVKRFRPKAVHIDRVDAAEEFEKKTRFRGTVYRGPEGLTAMIRDVASDLIVNSLVGSAGFLPTVTAIECGADVALANKETLVAGGDIIMPFAKERGVSIIPIDSEHSAIFQIVRHFRDVPIHKLILTASGGPFRTLPAKALARVTPKDALKHPTWNMGAKISIDSATMMNKGLEVIEAHHLFGIPFEKIEVVIHPQSVIHSLVEFVDGEIYAQMGPTDMRYPIQNALTYPRILPTPFHRLDLTTLTEMNFYPPDMKKFPMLAHAYRFGKKGGAAAVAFNAANEVCVGAFLAGSIRFTDIPAVTAKIAARFSAKKLTVEGIMQTDHKARRMADEEIGIL